MRVSERERETADRNACMYKCMYPVVLIKELQRKLWGERETGGGGGEGAERR